MRLSPCWRGITAVLGGEFVSPPIGEATAFTTFENERSGLAIGDRARVVAQVKFSAVAAKVRFAHVVIGTDHAALEDRKEIFSGVAVLEPAGGDIFTGTVVHGVVIGKFAAHTGVDRAFVGHQHRGAINVCYDQRANVLGVHVCHVERASDAVALYKSNDCLLGGGLAG